jgi:hypothetical protein
MKVARLSTVVLVALFAIGASVTPSASALPKFGLPITKKGFTALTLTSVIRVQTSAEPSFLVITCPRGQLTGSILDDDEVLTMVRFSSCTGREGEEAPCEVNSKGLTGGLILTELLRGLLGLLQGLPGLPPGVGILFEAQTGHVYAQFKSCTLEIALEGSVAGLFVSPTTGKFQTAKIIFSVTGAGLTTKQAIKEILVLRGLVKPKLSWLGVTTSTEQTEEDVTFEEAVEVI